MNFNYRYPGSSPFEDNEYDRLLFFGRKKEQQDLFHLVKSEKLSVLFGKSGIGKTSLIHAGLNHQLRDEGFIPLVIRFHTNYADPFQAFYETIDDIVKRDLKECRLAECRFGVQDTLWEYFKTVEFWTSEDILLSPVVIFDHFEDFFFFYSPENRKIFIQELAYLVNNKIPEELTDVVSKRIPIDLTFEGSLYSANPPDVKILISIREDYLGLLEEIADHIPHIFQNIFRLLPLTREQAKEAIIEPAKKSDDKIQQHVFTYKNDALHLILEFIAKRKKQNCIKIINEIESFQLQLICRHIENCILKKSDKQQNFIITKQDLSGLSDIWENFYKNQMNHFGKKDKSNFLRLCQEGLILNNKMLSLEEKEIELNFKISKPILERLVNIRLLRKEHRSGRNYYELSHDMLIEFFNDLKKEHKRKKYEIVTIGSMITSIVCSVSLICNYSIISGLIILFILSIIFIFCYYHKINNMKVEQLKREAQKFFHIEKQQEQEFIDDEQIESTVKLKSNKEAIAMYNKDIESNPESATIYYNLGILYSDSGRYTKAIAAYNKAVELGMEDTRIFYNLGNAFSGLKRFQEAIEIYNKTIELGLKDAKVFYNLGNAFFGLKQFEKAIKMYNNAIQFKREDAKLYYNLGKAFYNLKRYQKAIDAFNNAVQYDPKYIRFSNNIGNAFYYLRKYEDAIARYKNAIELNPNDVRIYCNLGTAYKALKRYEEAIAVYKKAIELDPKYITAFYKLGLVYFDLKRFNEAIAAYNKAIELDSKNHFYYNILGILYTNLNQYKKAIAAFDKAIELDSKSASVEYDESISCVPTVQQKEIPSVFICHAKEDEDDAGWMFEQFRNAGFRPFIESKNIQPGRNWDYEIKKTIKEADFFIILKTKTLAKRREDYVNKEIYLALERQRYFTPDAPFIIPVRIEDCESDWDEELGIWWESDLTDRANISNLIKAIEEHYAQREKRL